MGKGNGNGSGTTYRYDGVHLKGAADGKRVTRLSYVEQFEGYGLHQLRVATHSNAAVLHKQLLGQGLGVHGVR